MRVHRKKLLFYSFFLFFIMACRTWGCSSPQNVPLVGSGPVGSSDFSCRNFLQISADPHGEGFVCNLTCPTGIHTFDLYDKELNEFINMTLPQVQAQYCPNNASIQSSSKESQPTEEPTEAPAPPTEAPTEVAPLKPYLTGSFTTCDNAAGYVNFTIADDAPAYDPATFKLLFNGQVAKCAPASNNPKILTCNYPPAPYGPPAYIEVHIGGERVNEFKFPGGTICDSASQPNNNNESTEEPAVPSGTEAPTEAPTEVPTDESTD